MVTELSEPTLLLRVMSVSVTLQQPGSVLIHITPVPTKDPEDAQGQEMSEDHEAPGATQCTCILK